MASDDVLQLLDDEPAVPAAGSAKPWTILIVDDDDAVHEGTRFALYNYALTAAALGSSPPIRRRRARASSSASRTSRSSSSTSSWRPKTPGLTLVGDIRARARATTRCGSSCGPASRARRPSGGSIIDYDINDYKAKTELTADKLFTTLTAALRSYQQLRR